MQDSTKNNRKTMIINETDDDDCKILEKRKQYIPASQVIDKVKLSTSTMHGTM